MKKMRKPKLITLVMLLVSGFVWTSAAEAIPAFARKYDKPCSACHTAYPQLNQAGRMFKEAGYQFPTDAERAQKISDFLYLDKYFPVSAMLVARPYDKKDSGNKKVRAIHEVEIIAGGVLGKDWSGWFEVEAEDENDFSPEFGLAVASYQYNKALNVQFVWGPYFWADPYGFLGDHFRMTASHVAVIDQAFGGADAGGRLRSNRQMVGLYGRPADSLFYNIGYSGVASDTEGVEASNVHGRLAFDATRDITVGLFAVAGKNDTTKRDFDRNGVDFQGDFGDLRLQAAMVKAKDDNAALTATDKNDAWSIQGIYVFKDGQRPTWAPVVRYDTYEKVNGTEEYNELVLNLTRYFTENIKGFIEYWKQLDVPPTKTEDKRVTLQLQAAF